VPEENTGQHAGHQPEGYVLEYPQSEALDAHSPARQRAMAASMPHDRPYRFLACEKTPPFSYKWQTTILQNEECSLSRNDFKWATDATQHRTPIDGFRLEQLPNLRT
jgi:hypothetical protein